MTAVAGGSTGAYVVAPPSLACHTPQSQGKRGLVTMRTTSCSGDQILSRPIRFKILNLLLSNVLLSARAFIAGHANFCGCP